MLPQKYLHFSVDDVCLWLKELTRSAYTSIFEHPVFSTFRVLHEKYGAVFTLNLFYKTKDGSFSLPQMTERFKVEWKANASWLRFSFHAFSFEVNYQEIPSVEALKHYEMVRDEVARFASMKCFDTVIRTHFFSGTEDVCRVLQKCSHGITGILTSDDMRIVNYYLNESARDMVYRHGYLWDETTGLHLFKSFTRLEQLKNPVAILEELYALSLKNSSESGCAGDLLRCLEIFWHEGTEGISRLEDICIWAGRHGYESVFAMDFLAHS